MVKVIKRGKISDINLPLLYTLQLVGSHKEEYSSTACMSLLDSRLGSTSGIIYTSKKTLLSTSCLQLILHLLYK